MRKLDNQGWGFVMFLGFLAIFLFAILMIVYMVNDLSDNFNSNSHGNVVSDEIKMYKKYENIVKKAAMSSANGKYNINIDDLNISDTIKKQCDGYALKDSSGTSYNAYIKCGSYESTGYNSSYE